MSTYLLKYKLRNYVRRLLRRYPTCIDRERIIFTHIPKAAGISLTNAIYGERVGHVPLQYYKSILQNYSSYRKVTVVRDPVDRLFSAYNFLKNGGINKNDQRFGIFLISNYPTFDQFVSNFLNEKTQWSYIHLFPQEFFLNPVVDQQIIINFNEISKQKYKIEEVLNRQVKIPKYNVGKYQNKVEFSKNTIEKIYKLYSHDLGIYEKSCT